MEPYPWQDECLTALEKSRATGLQSALIAVATGLGKTAISAFDARKYLADGGRLLYLCHQNQILVQARTTFEKVLGERNTLGNLHGLGRDYEALHSVDCLFSSFQTMREWLDVFKTYDFDYIVVDEGHHSVADTYKEVITYFKPDFLLGMTATPDRSDLNDIREIFGPEVFSLTLEEALGRGLLARVEYILMNQEFTLELEPDDKPKYGASLRQLNQLLFHRKSNRTIAKLIKQKFDAIENPRAIVFCPSIKDCENLAPLLPGAKPIHSGCSQKTQNERLTAYRSGEAPIAVTVDKFNEGIDVPETNLVVFLRSTASRTIFLQQLGRGLRPAEGKTKVVALDFVANCERLQLVYDLWGSVAETAGIERERIARSSQLEPLSLEAGEIEFSESARDVLEFINRINNGIPPEELAKMLRELAKKIGRIPRQYDLAPNDLPPREVFIKAFGSWKAALGSMYSKQELSEMLRQVALELRRPPRPYDLTPRGLPPLPFFVKAFGNWRKALASVGLDSQSVLYSEQELIDWLINLKEKLGRVPIPRDLPQSVTNPEPRIRDFTLSFGSFREALRRAGLLDPYTKEELIQHLLSLETTLGKAPLGTDIDAAARDNPALPRTSDYRAAFGGITAAKEAAGIRSTLAPVYYYTREQLIKQIQSIETELGRPPASGDLIEARKQGKCASLESFIREFGTLPAAREAAGSRGNLRTKYERGYLIEHLKKVAEVIGKPPTEVDLMLYAREHGGPSQGPYMSTFGSLKKAREVAGVGSKHYYKSDIERVLKKLASELGRPPTVADIDRASKSRQCPSRGTIVSRFGSIEDALASAGVIDKRRKLS